MDRSAVLFRRANLVAALLFFFSATLQFNDPDPFQWIAIYLSASMVSAFAAGKKERLPWYLPAAVGIVALVWGLAIASHSLGWGPLRHMFDAWEMKNAAVEENRESIGLFLVVAWMAFLTVASARRRRVERPAS